MDYRKQIKHIAAGGLYVNVYDVQQHYGGPEEGGWYYNSGEPLESHPVTNEKTAETLRQKLESKYNNKSNGKPPFGSIQLNDPNDEIQENWEPTSQADDESYIHSEGEIRVYIEDHPGRFFPTERPHYE